MTSSRPTATVFHPFPRLPPEIRLMVWEYCLPGDGPSLYPYRPSPNHVRPDGILYTSQDVCLDVNFDQLQISYDLPGAAYTCREARAAILPHAQSGANGRLRLGIRPFDVSKDVLYLCFTEYTSLDVGNGYWRASVAVAEDVLAEGSTMEHCCLRYFGSMCVMNDPPSYQLNTCREIRSGAVGLWKYNDQAEKFEFTANGDKQASVPGIGMKSRMARLAGLIKARGNPDITHGEQEIVIKQIAIVDENSEPYGNLTAAPSNLGDCEQKDGPEDEEQSENEEAEGEISLEDESEDED